MPKLSKSSKRKYRLPFKKSFLFLIPLMCVVIGFSYLLGWSKIVVVKEIAYVGGSQTEINNNLEALLVSKLAVVEPDFKVGEPLARLNLPRISKAISSLDWIARISISRSWLTGNVLIKVTPRVPIAKISGSENSSRFLDATGFEFRDPDQTSGLPQVTLDATDPATKIAISDFIAAMPADILESMQSLHVANSKNIVMVSLLTGNSLIIDWGGFKNNAELTAKVRVLRTLVGLPENAKITSINLRNLNSPIVK